MTGLEKIGSEVAEERRDKEEREGKMWKTESQIAQCLAFRCKCRSIIHVANESWEAATECGEDHADPMGGNGITILMELMCLLYPLSVHGIVSVDVDLILQDL